MTHSFDSTRKLREKLQNSIGYKLTRKINHFYLTTYIFNENFVELDKHLEKQTEPHNAFRLAHKENRKELESLQLETIRFLHNFIASAISLIDHTRIFVTDLYPETDSFFDEYQKEMSKRFIENPLAVFVKSFRQYVQHYQSPILTTVSNLTDNPSDMKSKVVIDKETLLQFSGWKAPAKKYIHQIGKELDIQLMTKEYHQLVSNFYNWFQKRQDEVHKKDFEELENINKKLALASLNELTVQFINLDHFTRDYFKSEIRTYMGTVEKQYFDNASLEQQLNFIISALKVNNIELTSEEENIVRKKYSR